MQACESGEMDALAAARAQAAGFIRELEPRGAGERREHLYVMGGYAHYLRQPQWSPPWNGGSIGLLPEGRPAAEGAAMGPASERREHDVRLLRSRLVVNAAMEPAAERREHPTRTGCRLILSSRRNGARRSPVGTSVNKDVAETLATKLQWSPPSGGSTPDTHVHRRNQYRAAMEPVGFQNSATVVTWASTRPANTR